MSTKRPNFLIFMTDEHFSGHLGCNGNGQVRSPHIDALAEGGVTFTRAYCNNTVCMPSRSTVITGLTPRQHGCLTNGTVLPETVPTLPGVLAGKGYRTHKAGKFHYQPTGGISPDEGGRSWESRSAWESGEISSLPENYYGFQTTDFCDGHVSYCFGDYGNWLKENHPGTWELYQSEKGYRQGGPGCWRMEVPPEIHYNNWIADRTMDFLDKQPEEENFFLFCSFPDPHFPYAACKPYSEMYDPAQMILPGTALETGDPLAHLEERRKRFFKSPATEEELKEKMAQTYGMITHVDHNVGRVMAKLEERGFLENTVVVFLADHGEYLGSHNLLHKNVWPYEELLKVPFIFSTPETRRRRTDADASQAASPGDYLCGNIVSLLDLVPTLLDYAGLDSSVLDNRGLYSADPVGLPGRSLRPLLASSPAEREEAEWENSAFLEYDEDWHPGPTYRMRMLVRDSMKLVLYTVAGGGLLFDLEKDPREKRNLYDDPSYREIRFSMTEELLIKLARSDRLNEKRISGA